MVVNFILTTASLAMVHERVPDRATYGPLPDVVLDNIPPMDWALNVSEILIMIISNSAMVFIIFHKHRYSQNYPMSNYHRLITLIFVLQIHCLQKDISANGITLHDAKRNNVRNRPAGSQQDLLLQSQGEQLKPFTGH